MRRVFRGSADSEEIQEEGIDSGIKES